MTNEEAIEQIKIIKNFTHFDEENQMVIKLHKAFDMAIKALEQQPCEDCISREEAKKLIQGKIDDIPKNKDGTYDSMFSQYVNGLYCAKTAISYMSPAVPQTKSGHWITDVYKFGRDRHTCSNCGKGQEYTTAFCSWCGADMRESEENADED